MKSQDDCVGPVQVTRLLVFVKNLHISEEGADGLFKDPTGEIEESCN